MKDDDAITASAAAAFLKAMSRALNQCSLLTALAAILILGGKHGNLLAAVSVLMALLQAYFAARCAFDAAIFAALGGEIAHYQCFDNLLIRWQLKKTITATRSLDERVNGAMRLLVWQAVSFVGQILVLAVALIR